MTMADRIVVLRDGLIEQCGTPLELYNRPANRFVAGFIGSPKMNFLDATVSARDGVGLAFALAGGESLSMAAPAAKAAPGDKVTVGIRPEHVLLAPEGMPVTVGLIEQLGGNTVLYGTLSAQQPVVVQVVGQSAVRRGDTVHVHFPSAACHAFDAQGRSLAE
jgi:ABC-type sugar transport system ATPase subunit